MLRRKKKNTKECDLLEVGECGHVAAVRGETAGHPSVTHITGYLTIPGRGGEGRRKGEKEKMERRSCTLRSQ